MAKANHTPPFTPVAARRGLLLGALFALATPKGTTAAPSAVARVDAAAADLADALEAAEFTREKVDSAGALRNAAARRVETAVATALQELHALLEPDQRARLAEFVRAGVIRI